jgi:hypothetical protein
MKNPFALGLIGIIVIVSGVILSVTHKPEAPVVVGAFPGPDVTEFMHFGGDESVGGTVLATSSQGTAVYTASQVMNNKVIAHTAGAALTVTLPASSTMAGFIQKPGDTKTTYITPVTTGITFAGGTGTDLNTASSTKFCVVGQLCRLDFVRKVNSDIEILLTNSSGV